MDVKMEAVLFDLDGTLLDTSKGVIESFFFVTQKLGYPDVSIYDVKEMIGSPVQKWFIKFFGVSSELAQEAANLFREYYLIYATTKADLYPGVLELLDILSKKRISIAVATYKREDCAIAMLNHFGIAKYCSSIHGADNFDRLTKSDIIDICLNELNIERKKVVYVGDTMHDALGAQNAGINFIGVTYGMGFKQLERKNKYPCLGVVDNIIEVAKLI